MTSPLSFLFTKRVSISRHDTIKSNKVRNRQRRGISPVIATTVILAITIVLGLSLWSFANSGVSTATSTYAETVSEYGRFAGDKFVIAQMDFNNPSSNNVAFWIYNSGKLPTSIDGVIITCKDCADFTPAPSALAAETLANDPDPTDPTIMESKTLKKFWFNVNDNIEPNKTYELTVLSDTGASHSYVKRSEP